MGKPTNLGSEAMFRLNIRLVDRSLRKTLSWQVLDPSHDAFGSFRNPSTLIHDQSFTCAMAGLYASAYFHPDSEFFRRQFLARRIEAISDYIVKVQHPDGSIDLSISNIWSAPDTGFAVRPISKAYRLLGSDFGKRDNRTCGNLATFLRKARRCLAHGKVHTPNHRWVVVAAMGEVNSLFPSKALRSASEDYLSEGIDVNKEGSYIYEKSNSIYNWISNKAIIDIAKYWERSDLLRYVRRNLDFMVFNVHPNGEVVDEYSRRQDRGTHTLLPSSAFDCYMQMALRDRNPIYGSMADLAFKLNLTRGISPAGYISRQQYWEFQGIPRSGLPLHYSRFFPVTGIVRIRNGDISATIMADNFNNFFTIRKGNVIIDSVKIRYNYWGWWNFNPKRIRVRDTTYELVDAFRGRTFHPGPKEVKLKANFKIIARIERLRGGFGIRLRTEGARNIVMQLELGIRPKGELSLKGEKHDLSRLRKSILFDSKQAAIEDGKDRILIDGGLVQHRIWDGWRGYDPWERYGKRTVGLLMTPISPVDMQIGLTAQ